MVVCSLGRAGRAEREQGRVEGGTPLEGGRDVGGDSGPGLERMRARFPSRFTAEGDVLIQSQKFRDQDRNREDCLAKLAEMIRDSLVEPLPRKATKPTRGSQRRRLADKSRQSERSAVAASPGTTDLHGDEKSPPLPGGPFSIINADHCSRSSMSNVLAKNPTSGAVGLRGC